MKIAYLALAVIANAAIANAAIAADEITSLPGWEGPLHDSTRNCSVISVLFNVSIFFFHCF